MHDYYSNRLPSTFNNFFKSINKVQDRLIVVVACEAQTYIFPVFASLQAIVLLLLLFSKNTLKIVPIHVYKSSFLNLEYIQSF